MMTLKQQYRYFFFLVYALLPLMISCSSDHGDGEPTGTLQLSIVRVGTTTLDLNDFTNNNDAPSNKPIVATFSAPLSQASVQNSVSLQEKNTDIDIPLTFSFLDADKTFSAQPDASLAPNKTFVLRIANTLAGTDKQTFPGYVVEFTTVAETLTITSLKFNGVEAVSTTRIQDVQPENTAIAVTFSAPIDPSDIVASNFTISYDGINVPLTVSSSDASKTITITPTAPLDGLLKYQLVISGEVDGVQLENFPQTAKSFYTAVDEALDFPLIADEDLLTLVQQQTFKYFWDLADPASGMARERNSSGNLVTTGGSGFGLMAIIVGIERNFITRAQGLERLTKILTFLETSDRFHGVWPHWINGNTGNVIPFSPDDNGGDLVETSFLVQGLLTFRQYLNTGIPAESALVNRINALWDGVEWDWYTRDGQHVLYWHWSPDKAWAMNQQIKGYNEALITYVLAASSSTHTIDEVVYQQGWANNGTIQNGKNFYGINLPVGFDYGGPLFFTHYSFVGLDPRNLEDTYADYWEQNVNHSKINQAYVVANPKHYVGYSDENWGLTASDNQDGYSAHSPTNDLGVISPTAALSSFPYTPVESMKALRFFYYKLGDRLWGNYGFYDAFNITEGWTADSYLAIDQGPIIVMVENHRSGLLWELFMSAPEVQDGLTKLGFTY
jgi:hypothetical protein